MADRREGGIAHDDAHGIGPGLHGIDRMLDGHVGKLRLWADRPSFFSAPPQGALHLLVGGGGAVPASVPAAPQVPCALDALLVWRGRGRRATLHPDPAARTMPNATPGTRAPLPRRMLEDAEERSAVRMCRRVGTSPVRRDRRCPHRVR